MKRGKSFLLALVAMTLTSSAFACGSHHGLGPWNWTPRSSLRSCYANQKTLAGAVEMYNLDFNTEVLRFDDALMRTLVDEGYLQRPLTCPNREARGVAGGGYVMAQRDDDRGQGRWIACLDHGFVYGPSGVSAYDQLSRVEGNEHLLDHALRVRPQQAELRWQARKQWQERLWAAVMAMGGAPLMALLAFLG